MEAVKISNLSYKYPSADEYCLKNVSFSVSEGEVCAIVGPNGCGKSNIIDAVRWVLGEGRIGELRGSSSMSELIFAGSTGRAPLGRASVELVLDNADHQVKGPWGQYEELSVRRVVTKEGVSAYYINHQQVRRRDVQEIFMGTGLGAATPSFRRA